MYLLYVRCVHEVKSAADNLKYLLPQLLPILIPSTFFLLGNVHQNWADRLVQCDLLKKEKKKKRETERERERRESKFSKKNIYMSQKNLKIQLEVNL